MEHDVAQGHLGQQVGIQRSQSLARDQALVDDGARGRRRDRELIQTGSAAGDLGAPPGEQETLLQVGPGSTRVSRHDGLLDHRQRGPCIAAQRIWVHGHAAPALEREPLGHHGTGQQLAGTPGGRDVPGQEQHEHTRIPGHVWREEPQERSLERQQDAGAVAGRSVGSECPAMGEGPQAREGERQHPVPCRARRVRDEADATGVMFEPRVVERVGGIEWHSGTSGRDGDPTGPGRSGPRWSSTDPHRSGPGHARSAPLWF